MANAERLSSIPRELYFGGGWHAPVDARDAVTLDPGDGSDLGRVAIAGPADVDAAVAAAR